MTIFSRSTVTRRRLVAVAVATAVGVLAALSIAAPAHAAGARASVVGGSDAQITALPHQAALFDRRAPSPFDGQYCGAVVLDATHVATAAHCVILDGPAPAVKPAEDIRVLAGTARLRAPGEQTGDGEREVGVARVRLHPDYSPGSRDADVAVLTTAAALYNGSPATEPAAPIAPIELQSAARASAAVAARAPATLSGWGFTASAAPGAPRPTPDSYPRGLQRAVLRLVSDAGCAESYTGLAAITPRMLCAGGGEPAACYGDSGGPLTDFDAAGRLCSPGSSRSASAVPSRGTPTCSREWRRRASARSCATRRRPRPARRRNRPPGPRDRRPTRRPRGHPDRVRRRPRPPRLSRRPAWSPRAACGATPRHRPST